MARSFAGIDDPFSGRRRPSRGISVRPPVRRPSAPQKYHARARALPPAPALGAGRWGLRAWGPWAFGRARVTSRSPRSPRSHARLTKTGAAADNGSLHADPAAHAAMPRCATRGQPLLACSAAAGGLPSGPGPLRSGLPPAGERLGAAGASPTSLAAAGEMPGFPHSYKKTSCFPHEINPVKSAIFF